YAVRVAETSSLHLLRRTLNRLRGGTPSRKDVCSNDLFWYHWCCGWWNRIQLSGGDFDFRSVFHFWLGLRLRSRQSKCCRRRIDLRDENRPGQLPLRSLIHRNWCWH